MTDYELLLQEMGLTQSQVDTIVKNKSDCVGMPANSLVSIQPSDIHGLGIFTLQDCSAGTVLVQARIAGFRTPGGRYTNHSPTPNALMVKDRAGDILLVAMKDIRKGEEVTINYRQAMKVR